MIRIVHTALLLAVSLAAVFPTQVAGHNHAQQATPSPAEVARLLDRLTPAERVGQLFIVTFQGRATDEESAIYELVSQYHVGGVALLAANDNFTDTAEFAQSTLELTSALQALAGQPGSSSTATPVGSSGQFIPLFIAAPYIEDSPSGITLLRGPSGLTQLPSPMTVGATWDPDQAETLGIIAGEEMAALGFNMLFGPTLDVIEEPQPTSAADLGARAFGGDPYWVGRMGQAFIRGVHAGSQHRMAVVAQRFPGYGASDRALEDQIPTVSKTLSELRAIDLAPFFAVSGPGAASGQTDALLVSHVRYRGLQENIRDTTRPISLDPAALGLLLGLPELAVWRANGGLTVSDALGVRAVRRFYDPTERTFQAFNIARDAFLAGNDVLYLGQFATPGSNDTEIVRNVLRQFLQKYNEDPAFAARVDQAVARILALKLKLYGSFTIRQTTPLTDLSVLGQGSTEVLAATRDAATLISPATAAELANRLPTRPSANQRIAFITDARTTRQCSACAARPLLAADALQQVVLRLYGPQGTDETFAGLLSSYTFADLVAFLDSVPPPATPTPEPTPEQSPTPGGEPTAEPTPAPPAIDEAITAADWIVIAMLDVKAAQAESVALKRLLAERPDLLQGKRVIVFAFDAPYYLDATEVAQLTAYFALYNRSADAVEVAARILFQEITPTGASPVSIDAIGYKLIEATQPDPDQVIGLTYDLASGAGATPTPPATTEPGAVATPAAAPVALNDVINLRTSVIVDRNGNQVPDGTPVRFWVSYINEGLKAPFAEVTTIDGIAVAPFRIDRVGQLEISVTSEPASREQFKLKVDVGPGTGPATFVAVTNTPVATATAPATLAPTVSPTLEHTATPTPPPLPEAPVTGGDLFMTLLSLGIMGAIAWRVTNSRVEAVSDGVKLILSIVIGALLAYNYYALRLPGSAPLRSLGVWAVPVMAWLGGAAGFGLGWWLLRSRPPGEKLARHKRDEHGQ